jgi:hypothetical protein
MLTVISANAQKKQSQISFSFLLTTWVMEILDVMVSKRSRLHIYKLAQIGMKFTQFYSAFYCLRTFKIKFSYRLAYRVIQLYGEIYLSTRRANTNTRFRNNFANNTYSKMAIQLLHLVNGVSAILLQAVIRIKKVSIFFMATTARALLIIIIPIIYGTFMTG